MKLPISSENPWGNKVDKDSAQGTAYGNREVEFGEKPRGRLEPDNFTMADEAGEEEGSAQGHDLPKNGPASRLGVVAVHLNDHETHRHHRCAYGKPGGIPAGVIEGDDEREEVK